MSIGQTEMSIRPLDEQKCPLDIQMCIRPLVKRNVHWTFCPLSIRRTEMSIGHPNVRLVHWTNGRMDTV